MAATATGSDGSLYVASVQNGEAIVSKYAGGDITSAPTWTQDLGALQAGGSIGGLGGVGQPGLCLGRHQQRQSDRRRRRHRRRALQRRLDAFVFGVTDNGTSATAGNVTYVGTSGSDTAAM